ncbi:hypothetical protein QNI19_35075 [Cytophagaceae bacterium DM2B3-1]|uniref:Uncharacterized protein n=2 Tax=Xanthocytophaga TaxID=3078918 RepID=A0ABT7D0A0_9BACT|nr:MULTISPECIES: hypothetical protein [Xanthocytophaga]MDJ1498219.1 hypothetical protein [Xanthocytophaga flavus]MDJ1506580.1 hypothetical protein [Xanthocytophaga agilis]
MGTKRTEFELVNNDPLKTIVAINVTNWSRYDYPEELNPSQLESLVPIKPNESKMMSLELRNGATGCPFYVKLIFSDNSYAEFNVVQRDAFEKITDRSVPLLTGVRAFENAEDNQPEGYHGQVHVTLTNYTC